MAVALLLAGCGADSHMKKGDKFFALGEYFDASTQYKKAYSATPPKERQLRGQRALKLAECYRRINYTQKAIAAYNNALRYKQADSMTHLRLAQQQMKTGNYKEAAKNFQAALDSLPGSRLAATGLRSARMAPQWKEQGSQYTVKREDFFNSRRADYSPMLAGDNNDQLYFTSTRTDAKGDELSGITGMMNGDIFVATKDENGKWQKPEAIDTELNSEFDEGACSFSPDGKTMYLTQCTTDPSYPRYATICTSARSDASWGKPAVLELTKDTLSSYAHPAVSPDGEWLYFTSDMPGGMGGLDIYIAKPDSAGGTWHIEHPGFPLNSQGDDFGMTFEGLRNQGYFSSNRGDAKGWDHIYSFVNPEIVQTVKGWVYEQEGYELPQAVVYMVGNDGTNLKLSVKGDGSFTQQIRPGVDYVLLGTCKGFLNHKEQLRVEPVTESQEYVLQFPLASITAPVLIDNIFYDFDKATLRPESTQALDELIKLLNENPNVTIELSAHCDYRGAIEYNRTLSQKRAESVVSYLVEHGIAADRLSPVGYGKEKPKTIRKKLTETYTFLKEGDVLTEDFIKALKPEEQEICNQLNRRTEFIVLRTTYGMFDEHGNLKNPPQPKTEEQEAPAEPEWTPW